MQRVVFGKPLTEGLIAMAEGNPGAISILMRMMQESPDNLVAICLLDDWQIYGSDIWIAYKNVCNEDLTELLRCIRDRTLRTKLIVYKNKEAEKYGGPVIWDGTLTKGNKAD